MRQDGPARRVFGLQERIEACLALGAGHREAVLLDRGLDLPKAVQRLAQLPKQREVGGRLERVLVIGLRPERARF
jgi:hypothetical protein